MAIPSLRGLVRVLEFRFCNMWSYERSFSTSSSFGIQFLVEKCRIPLKLSSPLAQKIHFEEKASSNVKSVITFFKSHGFSDAEIAKLIQKDPLILHSRISSNLNPKLQYLIESGFKGSLLRQIVLRNPDIFSKSLSSTIEQAHGFLKTVLGSDESVRVAIRRGPMLLTTKNLEGKMKTNIEYLAKQGMSYSRIIRLTVIRPITMILNIDKMVNNVERIKELGVMPGDVQFLHALRVMGTISESTWKRKAEVFKSMGWSNEDVISTFAKCSPCFSMSEKKLRAAMDLFVTHMRIPQEEIIARPVVFTYSLEERVRPRCRVMKALEAEKLLDRWSLVNMLSLTEEEFRRRYITKHINRVPHLLDTYQHSKKSDLREEGLESIQLSRLLDEEKFQDH